MIGPTPAADIAAQKYAVMWLGEWSSTKCSAAHLSKQIKNKSTDPFYGDQTVTTHFKKENIAKKVLYNKVPMNEVNIKYSSSPFHKMSRQTS